MRSSSVCRDDVAANYIPQRRRCFTQLDERFACVRAVPGLERVIHFSIEPNHKSGENSTRHGQKMRSKDEIRARAKLCNHCAHLGHMPMSVSHAICTEIFSNLRE